jgi:hypothetical protein
MDEAIRVMFAEDVFEVDPSECSAHCFGTVSDCPVCGGTGVEPAEG